MSDGYGEYTEGLLQNCRMMNRVSKMCKKLFNERGVKRDQEHPDFDLHQVCAEVIHFMQTSGWMASDG